VGVFPGEPRCGDDPTANPGSELDQQYRSIELARLTITRNQTEIDNLAEEVQIEINRAFDEGQNWLYFMVRTLEQKWALPSAITRSGPDLVGGDSVQARQCRRTRTDVAGRGQLQ